MENSDIIVFTSGFKAVTGRRKAKMKSVSPVWYSLNTELNSDVLFFMEEDLAPSKKPDYKEYSLKEIYDYATNNDMIVVIDGRVLKLAGDDGIKVCCNSHTVYNGSKTGRKIANRDVDIEWIADGELKPNTILYRAMDYIGINIFDNRVSYNLNELIKYAESIGCVIVRKVNRTLSFEEK